MSGTHRVHRDGQERFTIERGGMLFHVTSDNKTFVTVRFHDIKFGHSHEGLLYPFIGMESTARCHPRDEFKQGYGLKIAMRRLLRGIGNASYTAVNHRLDTMKVVFRNLLQKYGDPEYDEVCKQKREDRLNYLVKPVQDEEADTEAVAIEA